MAAPVFFSGVPLFSAGVPQLAADPCDCCEELEVCFGCSEATQGDLTANQITVEISGTASNGSCSSCESLDGTYVLDRTATPPAGYLPTNCTWAYEFPTPVLVCDTGGDDHYVEWIVVYYGIGPIFPTSGFAWWVQALTRSTASMAPLVNSMTWRATGIGADCEDGSYSLTSHLSLNCDIASAGTMTFG